MKAILRLMRKTFDSIINMRLYVENQDGKEIPLNATALTRKEFAAKHGNAIEVESEPYDIEDVYAKCGQGNMVGTAILGGLLGLVTGGAGAFIGAAIGGVVGNNTDSTELAKVKKFNNSTL